MNDIASTFAALRDFCGSWLGHGQATFPTIGAFKYREHLRIVADPERPLLFFEQRAEQRASDASVYSPSHWEAGFLLVVGAGSVRFTNAQDNGRLELLSMQLECSSQGLRLFGTATGHFNDPHMVAAYREYVLVGDELRYRVEMATTSVSTRTLHLSAGLRREAT